MGNALDSHRSACALVFRTWMHVCVCVCVRAFACVCLCVCLRLCLSACLAPVGKMNDLCVCPSEKNWLWIRDASALVFRTSTLMCLWLCLCLIFCLCLCLCDCECECVSVRATEKIADLCVCVCVCVFASEKNRRRIHDASALVVRTAKPFKHSGRIITSWVFFFLGCPVRVIKALHTWLSTPCGRLPQHFAHYTLFVFGRAVAEARRSCCTSSGQVQIRVEQIWVPNRGSPQFFFPLHLDLSCGARYLALAAARSLHMKYTNTVLSTPGETLLRFCGLFLPVSSCLFFMSPVWCM